MEEERLQKYLANCGVASRRKSEEYILQGKVKVNGKIVTELGIKVNPTKDIIEYNGKKVTDLVKNVEVNLLPVGRLDMYTSGALILTNDGDFIYKITHPKHEITKTYTLTVRGVIENDAV